MCSKRLSWIGSRLSASFDRFVMGWSLEGRACVEGRVGKVCTLGGWGSWGHGQGEDVPCHPQTPSLMSKTHYS